MTFRYRYRRQDFRRVCGLGMTQTSAYLHLWTTCGDLEWKAFTGRERDGQRVELRWCSHGINTALHHGAPLFGVGASIEGYPSPKTEVGKKITIVFPLQFVGRYIGERSPRHPRRTAATRRVYLQRSRLSKKNSTWHMLPCGRSI